MAWQREAHHGDFTSNQQSQWKQALLQHSINPVQQFACAAGGMRPTAR